MKKKNQRGFIFPFVLMLFVLVSIIGLGLIKVSSDNSLSSSSEYLKAQGEYVAKAGIEIALAALNTKDPKNGMLTQYDRVLQKGTGSAAAFNYSVTAGTKVIDIGEEDIIIKSPDGKSVGIAKVNIRAIIDEQDSGIKNKKQGTWIFRVESTGNMNRDASFFDRFPMARQTITAEGNIVNPEIIKYYQGFHQEGLI